MELWELWEPEMLRLWTGLWWGMVSWSYVRLRAGTQSRCESDCDWNDVQIKFTVFKFVSMLINLPKMNHSYHGIKRTNDWTPVLQCVNAICIIELKLKVAQTWSSTPKNSSNLGVSILPNMPSPHGDKIRGCSTSHTRLVLLLSSHIGLRTNFTPWCGDAVAYGNTTQHFHPSLTFAGTRDRTWIASIAALYTSHYTKLVNIQLHWLVFVGHLCDLLAVSNNLGTTFYIMKIKMS